MTKKKVMMAAMSTALVAVVGVGGTLAYLSAQSEAVSNVFTVGDGYITVDGKTGIYLDEIKVNDNGTTGPDRVTDIQQTYPDMMPGDTREKDPTVYFVDGSVKSYVFVKVTGTDTAANNHLLIQDAEGDSAWNTDDWKKIYELNDTENLTTKTTGDGYYIYCGDLADAYYVIDREDEDRDVTKLGDIFSHITFEDVTNDQFAEMSKQPNFGGTEITISACAVQAADDGTTYTDAFAEATFATVSASGN